MLPLRVCTLPDLFGVTPKARSPLRGTEVVRTKGIGCYEVKQARLDAIARRKSSPGNAKTISSEDITVQLKVMLRSSFTHDGQPTVSLRIFLSFPIPYSCAVQPLARKDDNAGMECAHVGDIWSNADNAHFILSLEETHSRQLGRCLAGLHLHVSRIHSNVPSMIALVVTTSRSWLAEDRGRLLGVDGHCRGHGC